MASQSTENNKFTFIWKIEDINFHDFKNTELRSPSFHVRTSESTSWYLSFGCDALTLFKHGIDNHTRNIEGKIEIYHYDYIFSQAFLWDTSSVKEILEIDEQFINICDYSYLDSNIKTITVHCTMNMPEALADHVSVCKARTKIETEQCSFKWIVKDFLTVDQVCKEFYCSPLAQLRMTLSKCGSCVKIVIEKTKAIRSIFVVCKIALLDVNGFVSDSRRLECSFKEFGKGKIWKVPNFIAINDLFVANGKYLEYNSFSLKCDFSLSEGITLDEVVSGSDDKPGVFKLDKTADSFDNVRENFHSMSIDSLPTDVEIYASGHVFYAHKHVLSAMSPVFADNFKDDAHKNLMSVMNITDMRVEILDIFLKFMYSGTVDNMDYCLACELLVAANSYKVSVLVDMCSDFLMSDLHLANVLNVLILADKVSHEVMKNVCIRYIVQHFNKIVGTQFWSNFVRSNVKIVTEIMKKIVNSYSIL